jgi:putative MATE family efflux protein
MIHHSSQSIREAIMEDKVIEGALAAPRPSSVLAVASQLLRFAFPATLIILLSATSLLVDTYFVTRLGSAALAGVSLVFPFYLFLIMAFGGGIGVGISVVLAVRLGSGAAAAAQRAIGSAFALAIGFALLVALGFALGGRSLFSHIADAGPVVDAAISFARPIFLGAPIIAACLTLSNVLRSEKRVKEAAVMLLVSSGVNALLNPVLIHGYLGAPAMGVAGAGVATVAGFLVSAVLGVLYLRRRRGGQFYLDATTIRVDRRDMLAIARIALPTLATYVVTNCTVLVLSIVWERFGTDALASYGLATRLEYLHALMIYGIGTAILTLGGEAWGAGKPREFARICWIAAGCVTLAALVVATLLIAAPSAWFRAFGASPDVVEHGVRYLRIAALSYPFYALFVILTYAYQTVGRAHLPLVWALLRGFAIAVPITASVAAPGASVYPAAVAVAVSFVFLGLVSAIWLPRSIAIAGARTGIRVASAAPRLSWSSLPALPSSVIEPGAPDRDLPRLSTIKASALQLSPYPLWYTLLWPWFFRRPSTANRTAMATLPRRFERAEAAAQPRIRICAVGDILPMQRDRVPLYDPALRALFASADLIVGTCEAAIGRPDCDAAAAYGLIFNMPAAYLRALIDQSGVPPERWYLSAANNHSGDIGPDGLSSTIRYLRSLGVHPLGARIAGQPPLTVIEHHGLRVGLAAWTGWMNLPEPRTWQTADILSVPWPELRAAHRLDALIGSAHWEYEWQHFPSAGTRGLARRLRGDGFDLVIGSHTHVLQPLEWIDDMLCAYSLGNFCSDIGIGWTAHPPAPARMCNVLTVELGTEGAYRGRVVGYELHLFIQVDDGQRVSLVPLDAAPEPLRRQLAARAAVVLAP